VALDRTQMTLHERLIVLMGEIQYADVLVEDEMRVVLLALSPTVALPRLYGNLLRTTQDALLASEVASDDLKALGERVLEDVNRAHGERSRLLHDRWVPDRGELGKWRSGVQARRLSQRRNRPPRDLLAQVSATTLEEFETCLVTLRRLRWRLGALEFLLNPSGRPDADADELDTQRDIVEDRFSMSRDGMSITYPG
jgi:hypothetical protein